MSKRGYKHGYDGVDFSSIPEEGRINPYDYISQDNYYSTKRGQAAYAEDLAQLQYLADLRQQDWQNAYNEAQLADSREYNSYENQANLMREAGLNPDLLGVSSGSSSPLSSASGPSGGANPMQGMPTLGETTGNIISIIGTVAQVASGLFTGGLSAIGATLSNASAGVDLIGKIVGAAGDWNGLNVPSVVSSLPVSRSQRKKLNKIYSSVFGSPVQEDGNYRFWTKYRQNYAEHQKSLISPFLNPDDYNGDGIIEVQDWSYVWEPIFEAQFDIMKKELSSRESDLDLDSKRFSKEESDLDYMAALKEPFRDVIQRMKAKYDDGNDFWGYALSVLYAILSNSFSFSSSTTPSKYGDKSSISFGIK